MLAKGKNTILTSKAIFFLNFLPEKNMEYLHIILWNKNVLCEKGDEITRFDGMSYRAHVKFVYFILW